MLIVLLPLLVTQSIALGLVYGTYLSVASRRLTTGVAGEIAMASTLVASNPSNAGPLLEKAALQTQLQFFYHPDARIGHQKSNSVIGPADEDFATALKQFVDMPFAVDWRGGNGIVRTNVQLPSGVLEVGIPLKRLRLQPLWFFVVWALGSSVVLFLIAGLFMRNQVRAIRRLAKAAEMFGLGRDRGPIRPQGAREVRQAALAFNRMQERVNRFVAQRTAVLAGVSHDLRTPLTRLRLTMAMLPVEGQISAEALRPDIADMVTDIEDMERLIGSYLSFARGEGAELPTGVDLLVMVEDVMAATRRAGGRILGVDAPTAVEVIARPDALRRVLTNLAENARLHGGAVRFSLRNHDRYVEILVEDDGPGIPEDRREQLFQAFEGGGAGRGTGLGLTIVRDIIHAHGGFVRLLDSPLGGLGVLVSLPR